MQTTQRHPLQDQTNVLQFPASKPDIHDPTLAKPSLPAPVPAAESADVLLSIYPKHMDEIVRGDKNFEFRKYRCGSHVQRIWFFSTAPVAAISHVCEIGPVRTRGPGHAPLPVGPGCEGNREFNEFHPDWDKYDFAYELRAVYELCEPVSLQAMQVQYGLSGVPKKMPYAPEALVNVVDLREQKRLR